jgi:hypothetical protein
LKHAARSNSDAQAGIGGLPLPQAGSHHNDEHAVPARNADRSCFAVSWPGGEVRIVKVVCAVSVYVQHPVSQPPPSVFHWCIKPSCRTVRSNPHRPRGFERRLHLNRTVFEWPPNPLNFNAGLSSKAFTKHCRPLEEPLRNPKKRCNIPSHTLKTMNEIPLRECISLSFSNYKIL